MKSCYRAFYVVWYMSLRKQQSTQTLLLECFTFYAIAYIQIILRSSKKIELLEVIISYAIYTAIPKNNRNPIIHSI